MLVVCAAGFVTGLGDGCGGAGLAPLGRAGGFRLGLGHIASARDAAEMLSDRLGGVGLWPPESPELDVDPMSGRLPTAAPLP